MAAVFAATLAFGRVAAFQPVIEKVLDVADRGGGPAAWVDGLSPLPCPALQPIQYRWLRGLDLNLLAATIGRARRQHGSLRQLFSSGWHQEDPHIGPALETFIGTLRLLAVQAAPSLGLAPQYSQLPHGFRHALPAPSGGSACKRWNMMLRWLIRPPTHPGDLDLGTWPLPPAQLVIPLDTHVLRVAQLIGLTKRTDGSWRTAVEVTQNLARIDPDDPVRFDFVLAHLGISGRCRARHDPNTCASCPLAPVCHFGQG